jgi:hypothetical protein
LFRVFLLSFITSLSCCSEKTSHASKPRNIVFFVDLQVCCIIFQTGTTIIIRGKGSVKEGKVGYKDGRPLPAQDEPLHAYITSSNPENVKKAVDKV